MIKFFTALLLFLSLNSFSFSQLKDTSPLQGKLLLSLSGGITIPQTDFKDLKPAALGIGAVEYYFDIRSRHAFGLRIDGGMGMLKGTDERHIPTEYSDNIFILGGGAIYNYAVTDNFLPYILLGAANVWINPKDINGNPIIPGETERKDKSRFNFNWELGFKIMINERFSLNFNGGEYLSAGDELDGINAGKYNDVFLYATAGISVSFLGEGDSDGDGVLDSKDACPDTPPGVRVDLIGCPVDNDNDGIPDYKDKCPDTPAGVKVNDNGCPVDTDNDGVPDYLDKCPDTPAGAPVNEFGCVKDSDNDGVPDFKDKCQGTPSGIKVDNNGCPEDLNNNGIPDYLEVETHQPVQNIYDAQNEYNAGNMIFTDGKIFTAQISAWKTKEKAESQVEKFRNLGYNAFLLEKYIEKFGRVWYRVRVGYFANYNEALMIAQKLRDKNIPVDFE